ncbi:hypothetical protein [Sodalis-like endosymbiont of Proechinophthirus fluctus]|nr:hypothetical protein [Sodalis-like endosymbiont of Proechinophthirus fluctus]
MHKDQLDALLNKLNGFVTRAQHILVPARYHHLLHPARLAKAETRCST